MPHVQSLQAATKILLFHILNPKIVERHGSHSDAIQPNLINRPQAGFLGGNPKVFRRALNIKPESALPDKKIKTPYLKNHFILIL
jgi:hypothetical protein